MREMTPEWKEWGSPDWPGWEDIGKRAEFRMRNGELIRGVLAYEEMTPGPDEQPLIFIERANGTRASLVDAEFWRYV